MNGAGGASFPSEACRCRCQNRSCVEPSEPLPVADSRRGIRPHPAHGADEVLGYRSGPKRGHRVARKVVDDGPISTLYFPRSTWFGNVMGSRIADGRHRDGRQCDRATPSAWWTVTSPIVKVLVSIGSLKTTWNWLTSWLTSPIGVNETTRGGVVSASRLNESVASRSHCPPGPSRPRRDRVNARRVDRRERDGIGIAPERRHALDGRRIGSAQGNVGDADGAGVDRLAKSNRPRGVGRLLGGIPGQERRGLRVDVIASVVLTAVPAAGVKIALTVSVYVPWARAVVGVKYTSPPRRPSESRRSCRCRRSQCR